MIDVMGTQNGILINEIYAYFKAGNDKHYNEEKHCKLLIDVMMDEDKGTLGAFCVEARIS